MTEFEENSSIEVNQAGCYQTVCVELDMASVALNTLLQVCGYQKILNEFQLCPSYLLMLIACFTELPHVI